ncbi:MAG TPA: galactokinase family protein [Solirubrobacterales bacterium]|nr:galactokinase family protein [Solirubrobacterales bacterium]
MIEPGRRLSKRVIQKPDGRYLILYEPADPLHEAARQRFRSRFRAEPKWVGGAPGRVNLIGEHVDYLGGPVLPVAVDRRLAIALGPAERWDVDSAVEGGEPYVRAVAEALGQGPLRAAIVSDLRPGSGLSSSAALLVACAAALAPELDGVRAAELCRAAEQAATGVQVGIMDQFASALGRKGAAILLNCDALDHEYVPFPDDLVIAVVDSGVHRRLVDTPYNQRRSEAEAAMAGARGESAERRRRHVVSEIARVREFVDALGAGDHAGLGRLLIESHRSLREDFEVSIRELDELVEAAAAVPWCLGARLLGAGFGGSVLALLEAGGESAFAGRFGDRATICFTATGPFAR